MQTAVFGPIAWTLLQSLPRLWALSGEGKTVYLKPSQHQSLNVIVYSIAIVLPCRYCRESFRRFIQYIDIKQWLQQPEMSIDSSSAISAAAAAATTTATTAATTTTDAKTKKSDEKQKGGGGARETKGSATQQAEQQAPLLSCEDFEYWMYLVHNLVNQKLHKKWQRNKDAVYGGRVIVEERGFMNNLFDWFFILMMNYEPLERSDAAPLKHVGKLAMRRGSEWIEHANRHQVTLGALLEQIFQTIFDHELCSGGVGATAMSSNRWKKSCWYVFHFAHLVQALEHVSSLSDSARRALAMLQQFFVEQPHETLQNKENAFARLYQARCAYDPTCPPFEQLVERIASYKASDKSRDTSSASASSAAEKH